MKTTIKVMCLLLATILVQSCKDNEGTIISGPDDPRVQSLNQFQLDHLEDMTQQEVWNHGSSLVFNTAQGTNVNIGWNAFLDEFGNPYPGSVTVKIADLYEPKDMILSGIIPETSDGNMLTTSGEFRLQVLGNAGPVHKNPTAKFEITSSPSLSSPDEGMSLWDGVQDEFGQTRWEPTTADIDLLDTADVYKIIMKAIVLSDDPLDYNIDTLRYMPMAGQTFEMNNQDVVGILLFQLDGLPRIILSTEFDQGTFSRELPSNTLINVIGYGYDSDMNFHYIVENNVQMGSGSETFDMSWTAGTAQEFTNLID